MKMVDNAAEGRVFFARETFRERLSRAFGYHHGHALRPGHEEEADGWAPSWFIVETWVHLDWVDRLRLLVSGNLHVEQAIKTDVPINRSRSTSGVGILAPGKRMGMR